MSQYRYILEPYNGSKTRFNCPKCGKNNSYTRYIDINTEGRLDIQYGLCNRRIKCGYHSVPSIHKDYQLTSVPFTLKKTASKTVSYIDENLFRKSITPNSQNHFISFLNKSFGKSRTIEAVNRYKIGTSKHWNGATVFWQVDPFNKIRTGKIMLYNPDNGKRIKKPYNHINWVHSVLKMKEFNLQQCYFGAHLLDEDRNRPIAIVESEKTAVIASIHMPEFTWMACGSLNNINNEKMTFLNDRQTILFPDLGCFDVWQKKSQSIQSRNKIIVSDLLKNTASLEEKEKGLDISDYLTLRI